MSDEETPLHQGYLNLSRQGQLHKRYFAFYPQRVDYWSTLEDCEAKKAARGQLSWDDLAHVSLLEDGFSFTLKANDFELVLKIPDGDSITGWVDILKRSLPDRTRILETVALEDIAPVEGMTTQRKIRILKAVAFFRPKPRTVQGTVPTEEAAEEESMKDAVYSGLLSVVKKDADSQESRFFVLTRTKLLYYDTEENAAIGAKAQGHITFDELAKFEEVEGGFDLALTPPRVDVKLRAGSPEEMQQWMDAWHKVCAPMMGDRFNAKERKTVPLQLFAQMGGGSITVSCANFFGETLVSFVGLDPEETGKVLAHRVHEQIPARFLTRWTMALPNGEVLSTERLFWPLHRLFEFSRGQMSSAAHARLIFSRHGESEWNVANRFTGWVDVDLSKNGIGEAKSAGAQIKETGVEFDMCYTSYLKRAIKTCSLALEHSDQLHVPVVKSWRLNERMYGGLTGLDKKETVVKHGAEQVHLWRRSFDVPPPVIDDDSDFHPKKEAKYKDVLEADIPQTESLKAVIERVMPFWECTIMPDLKAGKTVFVVAHGNSIRAVVKFLEGISDDDIPSLEIPTGTPLVYEFDAELKPLPNGWAQYPLTSGRYLGDVAKIQAAAEVA